MLHYLLEIKKNFLYASCLSSFFLLPVFHLRVLPKVCFFTFCFPSILFYQPQPTFIFISALLSFLFSCKLLIFFLIVFASLQQFYYFPCTCFFFLSAFLLFLFSSSFLPFSIFHPPFFLFAVIESFILDLFLLPTSFLPSFITTYFLFVQSD